MLEDYGDPQVGWKDAVTFYDRGPAGPIAFRPKEMIRAKSGDTRGLPSDEDPLEYCPRDDKRDVLAEVDELRHRGVIAQPNHVYFAHCYSYASGVTGNPAFANPAFANPAFANPAFANPAFANPAFANPAFANPAFANPAFANPAFANPAFANPAFANPADPIRKTGLRRTSARPPVLLDIADQTKHAEKQIGTKPVKNGPKVVILDTGLAGDKKPKLLGLAPAIGGDAVDKPDADGNHFIDGSAGHGTFIAGLVKQVAPGSHVEVKKVLTSYGDGDEATIVDAIKQLTTKADDRTLLNLSFGGYVWEQPFALASAIRKFQGTGGVVVASAGNDGSWLPSYPAALRDVVSVGALGPSGPAHFTNYGPWVRACAPGVDLLSMFFEDFEGQGIATGTTGLDPDSFKGWALWSGTSFAAPVVVGALARTMMMRKCSAKEAVDQVIDAPSLMRIPNLGTVVNMI